MGLGMLRIFCCRTPARSDSGVRSHRPAFWGPVRLLHVPLWRAIKPLTSRISKSLQLDPWLPDRQAQDLCHIYFLRVNALPGLVQDWAD